MNDHHPANITKQDWRECNLATSIAAERLDRLETIRPLVGLHDLLSPNTDRAVFSASSADHVTIAVISVAQLKDLMLAVNACSERIALLVKENDQQQERIDSLTQKVAELESALKLQYAMNETICSTIKEIAK